jgi:hypothetical protein
VLAYFDAFPKLSTKGPGAGLIGDLKATRLIFEEGASLIGQSEIVPMRVQALQIGDKALTRLSLALDLGEPMLNPQRALGA